MIVGGWDRGRAGSPQRVGTKREDYKAMTRPRFCKSGGSPKINFKRYNASSENDRKE